MKKILIGVTDCSKYEAYAKWVSGEPEIEPVKLSYHDDNFKNIEKCHGILLTGGEDVHPSFYNKPEYLGYCYPDDIDERRDDFEMNVLRYSQEKRIPVLGICRGLQIANVFFGGTLVPDIPSFGKFNHSKNGGSDRYHNVMVDPNSRMKEIVISDHGEINSAHHQSAEIVGPDLVSNAITTDGVIEGLEWKNPEGKPYLMLVQWHPERMKDQQSAFTKNIRRSFLDACQI